MRPRIRTLAEAVERLQSATALEAFSPLTGEPALIVDLTTGGAFAPEALAVARARLVLLPCPTVAIVGTPGDAGVLGGPLAGFDVVLASAGELSPLVDAVVRAPLAAMTLAQLLRHGATLDLHEALVAESLAYATLQSGPEHARWLAARGPAPHAASPRPEPAVLATRSGGRLDLVLDRPERHNAFSAEMRDALAAGLQLAVDDASITEVVLRGRGPSFCSGGDLDEFGSRPDPATAHAVRSTRNVGRLLAACGERLRVELHGACIGAGIELAAFAARVVARRDTFVELPEVAMGLVPGAGGTASLPRRIGRQRTALLALTGMRIDAATAERWGLVDALVD